MSRGPRFQVRPRSCPTLRSVLPRQQPSRRHRRAIPSRRCRSLRLSSSRLRTAAPTPLAAADLKVLLRCRSPGSWVAVASGRCPDASLGFILERAGGRCSRDSYADEPRRAMRGIGVSVKEEFSPPRSAKEPVGRVPLQQYGVATPRSDRPCCEAARRVRAAQSRFLFPVCHMHALLARPCTGRMNREGSRR